MTASHQINTSQTLLSQNRGRPHMTAPAPHLSTQVPSLFVANIGAALVEKVFDISPRQRKPNLHHDA
jgi:hypothetical protein